MILNFNLRIEVPVATLEEAEKHVPYLRQLLSNRAGHIGIIKSVTYEPSLTRHTGVFADQLEQEADREGELPW